MPPRKLVTGMLLAAGSLAGSVLFRRRAARRRERVDLYAEDGSMQSLLRRGRPRPSACCRSRTSSWLAGMNRGELARGLREAA